MIQKHIIFVEMSKNINLYIIGSAPYDDRIQIPVIDDVDMLYNVIFENDKLTIHLFDPNYKNKTTPEIEYFDVHPIYFQDYLSNNPINDEDYYIIIDFIGNSSIIDLSYSYNIKYNEKIIFIPCGCMQKQFCYSLLLKPYINFYLKNDISFETYQQTNIFFLKNSATNILSRKFIQYDLFEILNIDTKKMESLDNILKIDYHQIYLKILFVINNNNLNQNEYESNIYLDHEKYALELENCISIHKKYIMNTFETIKNHITVVTSIIKHILIKKYLQISYDDFGIFFMHKNIFNMIENKVEYYYILLLDFLNSNNLMSSNIKMDEIKVYDLEHMNKYFSNIIEIIINYFNVRWLSKRCGLATSFG